MSFHRYTLTHEATGRRLATVEKLDGFWAKGLGAIVRQSLPEGTGLWLPQVASVHTMLMRFPIDILFLDKQFRLQKAVANVRPWTPLIACSGAHHTVELGAGSLADARMLQPGDLWVIRDAGNDA